MRKPYDVYSKYKYLQKKYLESAVQAKICKRHTNCRYNTTVQVGGMSVKMCMFGQHTPDAGQPLDQSKLIICSTDLQAVECNAYVAIYPTRADAENKLREELLDPQVKRDRYPDVVALEWVMDNELHQISKKPPTLKLRVIFWLIAKLEGIARGFYQPLSTTSQQEIEK